MCKKSILTVLVFVIGLCLVGSAYGSSLTIVDLPAVGTDAAIGIDASKTYTHTLDFGSSPLATINGVAFDQGPTANLEDVYEGVSSQGYGYIIDDTRSEKLIGYHGGNDVSAYSDGASADMLRDMIYYGSADVNEGIILTLQDLTPGIEYSVRWYYRPWDPPLPRPITIIVDSGESIDIDIDLCGGAQYLDYTFVADDNDVTMEFISNDDNQGVHLYGITCEVVSAAESVGLGDAATFSLDTSVLPDETWDHDNGNDQWDESAIGEGNPGGLSVVDGYLRFQDTGNPTNHGISDPGSNRKIYLTKDLELDNAATFLDDGATLFFTARLATDGPLDQIHPDDGGDLVDVPATGDGYLLHNEAKANINLDQADNGLIGFSLATADENPEGVAGLVMNALNGTVPSGDVDANEGTANMIELDPTVWHDFWVTIQADASGVGTHQVDISVDGGPAQTFIVTAGSAGTRHAGTAVLAMGVGSTGLSGAIDIAALQFAPGVIPATAPTQDPGTEGLLAYYPLDGDATDASGNGRDGIIMGDPGFVDGVVGQAIDLDGDGDYVDCGNDPNFSMEETNALTVSTWVTIRSVAHQWAALVAKGEHAWRVGVAGSQPIYHMGIAWGMGSDPRFFDGVTAVGYDEWHHVAAVYDGAAMMIYLDGALDNSVATTEALEISDANVLIGTNPDEPGRYWDGLIDEVLIYNRALSEPEIAYLAQ